jgi:DNA-binding MarR family transcriptional regulator
MTAKARTLNTVIRHIRSCFNQLRALGDDLHRDLGITASMRAVMESLDGGGKLTVPQIATAKGVSRQHIQVNVDALLHAGLVAAEGNPAHRRSPFILLTKAGHAAFTTMGSRENKLLEELSRHFTLDQLKQAADSLALLKISVVKTREGD